MGKDLKKTDFIFCSVTFILLYLFFTDVVPIIISDHDDWRLLSENRSFIITKSDPNPCKIFTENIPSYCTWLATTLIMPFNNDFIISISIISAIILSLVISTYIFHFIIFRNKITDNYFMFYSWDFTCYYNYTIPNILSASLVLYCLFNKPFQKIHRNSYKLKEGFFLMSILCVLLSNFFSSIIFISYLLSDITLSYAHNKSDIKKVFINKKIELFIITIWLIIHLIELFGGRAQMLIKEHQISENNFIDNLISSTAYLYYHIYNLNTIFILTMIVSIIGIIYYLRSNDEIFKSTTIKLILSCTICTIYLILLSTQVYPHYMTRTDVIFGITFYIFTTICYFINYLIIKVSITNIFIPIYGLIILFEINTSEKTFNNKLQNKEPEYWIQLNNYIISEIQKADSHEKSNIILKIPDYKNPINWPITYSTGKFISRSLHNSGLIKRPIEITIFPDSTFNIKKSRKMQHQ